jgi:biopolymer transport protein ExbB/TolQ
VPNNSAASHQPLQVLVPDDPAWLTFHLWLLIACFSTLALVIAARSGALAFIVEHDLTYISDAVLVIFVITTLVCGWRAVLLSREMLGLQALAQGDSNNLRNDKAPWIVAYLALSQQPEAQSAAHAALAEKLHGPHEIGWFITETLTKLGLLGTVIGFLVMLTALIGSSQLDITAMQSILRDMAAGMGIKIIATVVGLMCNMVLALQWLLLDRSADKIMAAAQLLTQHQRPA